MLYVFIVSSGSMKKFDMNLAVKKVIELKTEIFNKLSIPVDDQVLLCSGGEELKSDNIVGNYFGAGTDTNPIFLFSKYTTDSEFLYNAHLSTSIDLNIENDVRGCANMNPSSNAATVRSALAQKFAEVAVSGRQECDELVHGQHLQQQGWAAVIANLEDAKDSLMKRWSHFEDIFQKYLTNRPGYKEIIKTFPDDIELLSKVPLLPKLMLGNECIEEDLVTEHTLLSWFCSEPRQYLESLAEKCQRSLDELDEHSLGALKDDILTVLKNADNSDIKEVKGIEERLSLLNKQIEDAKKLEKDQRNLANWFNQTQGRISRDPQVLPDLCGTFQNQLELMLQNHKCLRDILERCTKAKLELSESINFRVKYICRLESEMYDLQVRIIFLEKHVRSVISQIESFRQVHLAPQRYLKMLAEVCRRKVFSSNFMKWATDLSVQAFKLYEKEISLRNSFGAESTKNMVDNLFPGMDDVPPPFAIECPRPFDQNLPNIVKEDLEVLRIRFPELSPFCEVPAPDPMPFISQAESDSAFSSNIPSSRIAGESADSGQKFLVDKGPLSPHKLAAPSADYSSLPSEFASLPNEVFSLTSSPFEDPLSHTADLELTKRTNTPPAQSDNLSSEAKSPAEEHMTVVESDGEEFETVEQYGTSPIEIGPQPSHDEGSVSVPRPTSSSNVINVNKIYDDPCPKISKACSDGDALSPIQERLKSSDSLVVSGDYYFDDSMPSSCTESNATSPLIRANKMVKTHHVIVAELQKQVEEKNGALVGASSSLKNSRSNILKLHAKISALQRFIQELKGSLQSDLSNLKVFVKEEVWERMSEVSQIVENVNTTMVHLNQQMLSEKEEALSKVKEESLSLENTYLQRLEVESQKLTDAENQISYYEEHLRQLTSSIADLRHEKNQLEETVSLKDEKISSMMLEHELELDSLRNLMKEKLQDQDDIALKITEELAEAKATICRLHTEKKKLEDSIEEKDSVCANLLHHQELDYSEKLKDMALLQEEVERLQEIEKSCKTAAEVEDLCVNYEKRIMELKMQKSATLNFLESAVREVEECKKREIQALEEKYKNEIQSLTSRYKLAVSTTSIDRVPSNINLETLESEAVIGAEDVKKIISEERNKWESEKEKKIANIRAEYEDNLEKLKARYTAESQVSFNKAINRLTKEKDAVIEELRSRISILEAKNGAIKAHLDKCAISFEYPADSTDAVMSQSDSNATSASHDSCSIRIISKLRQEMEPYFQLTEPLFSSESQESIEILRKKLKLKEEEFERLATKFIHVAGSSSRPNYSCIECKYKLCIFSCEVDDLILVYYDEKFENYKVFHLGNYQHFLHSDSFDALKLKNIVVSSDKWAVGIITSKEFCVTKKPNNRFRVNVGTKFYRVKVKPWDIEKGHEEYQLHRKVDPTIHASRISNVHPLPAEDAGDTDGTSKMSASAI